MNLKRLLKRNIEHGKNCLTSNKRDSQKKKDFNRKRNKVRKLTRHLHKDNEMNIARDAKKNPKRFWQ